MSWLLIATALQNGIKAGQIQIRPISGINTIFYARSFLSV